MTGIMSEKKSHEVEVMSEIIARLAKGVFMQQNYFILYR